MLAFVGRQEKHVGVANSDVLIWNFSLPTSQTFKGDTSASSGKYKTLLNLKECVGWCIVQKIGVAKSKNKSVLFINIFVLLLRPMTI